MSEADLFGDNLPTPAGDPPGDPPAADPTPAPAPAHNDALGGALERITGTLDALPTRLAALESRGATPPAAPAPPVAPSDPQAAFNEMYANPGAFVEQRAAQVADARLNDFASKITPFFSTIAEQLAARGTDAARDQFDASLGDGAFDRLVGGDLATALAQLPPAQRADANYVRALAAGVLGGKMLDPAGQKEIREVMAAARQRPAAPVVLTGNSASLPRDRLTENERDAIARVRRSGIAVDEKAFLEGRNRERTEEAWGATWMNPPQPARRPNGAAK
jgi:hypothetical protein